MAPLIATLLANGLSILGNAVLAKGKDVVEEKLGVKIEDAMQSEEGLFKLKELEIRHEETLLKYGSESEKLYFEDIKSARDMASQLSTSTSWLNQNIMPILAIYTVSVSTAVLWFVQEADVKMAATSFITMVLGFFFGSSKGSKDKQEALYKLRGEQS